MARFISSIVESSRWTSHAFLSVPNRLVLRTDRNAGWSVELRKVSGTNTGLFNLIPDFSVSAWCASTGNTIPLACLTGYAFQVWTVVRCKWRTETLQQFLVEAQSIRAANTFLLNRIVMLISVTVTADAILAWCTPIKWWLASLANTILYEILRLSAQAWIQSSVIDLVVSTRNTLTSLRVPNLFAVYALIVCCLIRLIRRAYTRRCSEIVKESSWARHATEFLTVPNSRCRARNTKIIMVDIGSITWADAFRFILVKDIWRRAWFTWFFNWIPYSRQVTDYT